MNVSMCRMTRKILRDDEGSALLEGAIVVPVLFSLIFGVMEFSYYFYQQHLVATGVRDAARYLAQVEDPSAGPAQTAAQNLASTGSRAGGNFRRVAGFDPAEATITFTFVNNDAALYRALPQLRIVHVTGSFTWAPLGFWGFLGFASVNVTVTHSERWIGVGIPIV